MKTTEEKNVPIPVGQVFPECADELTNGKGEEDEGEG